MILEAMLAASVMAFALTTTITVMQRGFLMLASARNLTIGNQILQGEIEKLTMRPWSEISSLPPRETLTVDPVYTSNPKIGNRYTLTRTVQPVRGNPDLLELKLTLSWDLVSGPVTRSFVLYYSRYGCFDFLYNST